LSLHTISLHDALPISAPGPRTWISNAAHRESPLHGNGRRNHSVGVPETGTRGVRRQEDVWTCTPHLTSARCSTGEPRPKEVRMQDRKSTRLNSSHVKI